MVHNKVEKLKIGHKKQKLVMKHNLIDLTLKEGGLFVCCVELSQTMAFTFLVSLESP
jgi:hypothetical protein